MMRGFLLKAKNSILVCLLDKVKISKIGENILYLYKNNRNFTEDIGLKFEEYYHSRQKEELSLEYKNNTIEVEFSDSYKISELVNKYHYNFVSWRIYKISKYKEVIFCLLYILLFILFSILVVDIIFRLFGENIFIVLKTRYGVILVAVYLVAALLLIVYRSIINSYSSLVVKNFSYLLNDEVVKVDNRISNRQFGFFEKIKRKFGNENKKNLRIIKDRWFSEMVPGYTDRFKLAQEFDKWQKLYEERNNKKGSGFLRIIINKEATVRILSLLIALFSLVTILVFNLAEPDSNSLIISLEGGFFSLYKGLFLLGLSFLLLGYEVYYIFPEVKNAFLDYMNDFNTDEEIYIKSRFDRFIIFLLTTHTYEVKKDSITK